MILELNFAQKTIKVKGTVKVSEVLEKVKELGLEDWSFENEQIFQNLNPLPYIPSYPSTPWDTQPYYTTLC